MKPDLYTKAVLTVIAACLLVLVARNSSLVPAAQAEAPARPATGQAYGLVPVNADGSITVRLQTAEAMPVNVVGIHQPYSAEERGHYNWDAIATKSK